MVQLHAALQRQRGKQDCFWPAYLPLAASLLQQSEDVEAAVKALAHSLGAAAQPRLERLEIASLAHLVLPSGALVPAALLGDPRGRQLLQARWPGLQVQRQQEGTPTAGIGCC